MFNSENFDPETDGGSHIQNIKPLVVKMLTLT